MRLSPICYKRTLSTSQLMEKLRYRIVKQEHEAYKQMKLPEKDKSYQMESMIASAFLRDNTSKFESFQRHVNKIDEINKVKFEKAKLSLKAVKDTFPYTSDGLTELIDENLSIGNSLEKEPVVPGADRGFFVKGDMYCDEYTAGTTANIPEDDMNDYPYIFYGESNAVEIIEMTEPHQMSLPKKKREFINPLDDVSTEDHETTWKLDYGIEDPNFKTNANIPCSGCGAKLHCHDSALPGFLPVELLKKTISKHRHNRREQLNELCRRCYMLKNYNFLLNVNVSPVNYVEMMGHLKLIHEALILLVVDMTDIRGSIHQQLPEIIGDKKPMIVIGNKADLLPPDFKPGYFKNFKNALHNELQAAGFLDRFNVLGQMLVSAKNGFGVEDLISLIYTNWMSVKGSLRGDIYVVGCTNTGKSTLFNAFLQSDLCKVRAVDLVERVTTSVWPGTTISLLKFPVMTPTAKRLELRRRRLLSHKATVKKEAKFQRMLFEKTNDPKYLSLIGHVESTFKELELQSQPLSVEESQRIMDGEDISEEIAKKTKTLKLDAMDFTHGQWCFDTPGTLLDLLSLDELIRVIPHSLILPRNVVCNAGDSLLIGGLARIDIVETFEGLNVAYDKYQNRSVFLTVFASDKLPINVMKTKYVSKFLRRHLGTDILGAPLGDQERLKKLPTMKSETFTLLTTDRSSLQGLSDILLSSVGWVLVSSLYDVTLKAFTPGGRGIGKRDPLLPNAAQMKGRRIVGTQMYDISLIPPEVQAERQRQRWKK